MRKFKKVWTAGSFESRKADELWDLYNENPSIQEKVDALFGSAVKTIDYKNRIVLAVPSPKNPDEANRVVWEIKRCGYCCSEDINPGYVINQGIFPHMCKRCRDAGRKPSLY